MERINAIQNIAIYEPLGAIQASSPANARIPVATQAKKDMTAPPLRQPLPPFGFAIGMQAIFAKNLRKQLSQPVPEPVSTGSVQLNASWDMQLSPENVSGHNHSTAEKVNDLIIRVLQRRINNHPLPEEQRTEPSTISKWLKAINGTRKSLDANKKFLLELQDAVNKTDMANKPSVILDGNFLFFSFRGDQAAAQNLHESIGGPQINYKCYLTPDDDTRKGRENYIRHFVMAAVEAMATKPDTNFKFKVCTFMDDTIVAYASSIARLKEVQELCGQINQSFHGMLCERWIDLGRTPVGVDHHGNVADAQRSETSILAERIAARARQLIASEKPVTEEAFIQIAAEETLRRAELMRQLGLDPYSGHSEGHAQAPAISEEKKMDILRELVRCDIDTSPKVLGKHPLISDYFSR